MITYHYTSQSYRKKKKLTVPSAGEDAGQLEFSDKAVEAFLKQFGHFLKS